MIKQITLEHTVTFKMKVADMVDSIRVSEFSQSKFKKDEYIKALFNWIEMKEGIVVSDQEMFNEFKTNLELTNSDVRKAFGVQARGELIQHLEGVSTLLRHGKSSCQFTKLFTLTPTEFKRMIPNSRKYLKSSEEEYLKSILEARGDVFKSLLYEILLNNGESVIVEGMSVTDAISKANLLTPKASAFKYKELRGTKWNNVNKNTAFNKYKIVLSDGIEKMISMVRVPEGLNSDGIKKYINSEIKATYNEDMTLVSFVKHR